MKTFTFPDNSTIDLHANGQTSYVGAIAHEVRNIASDTMRKMEKDGFSIDYQIVIEKVAEMVLQEFDHQVAMKR